MRKELGEEERLQDKVLKILPFHVCSSTPTQCMEACPWPEVFLVMPMLGIVEDDSI